MTLERGDDEAVALVERAVGALGAERRPLVLAVSGGLDSMVLLEGAARLLAPERLVIATFDHRTGPAARRAARSVRARARQLGLRIESGIARRTAASEAEWRAARWAFLRDVARRTGGVVVTAHTRDDQVETVLLRALRGAGPRGLAGLYASSPVRRPFLHLARGDLRRCARALGIAWIEDPSNRDLRYRRNRVRLEILPAMRRSRPAIDDELLAIARDAADWRREVEALVASITRVRRHAAAPAVHVAAASLRGYDRASLAVLWPAVAARAGVALDRRGTERLVGFTMEGLAGGSIQLAGGWEVIRRREDFVLRRVARSSVAESELPLAGALRWGRWSFFAERPGLGTARSDAWGAELPAGEPLTVRAWVAGDRMRGSDGRPRRVKRFLRDAGIVGVDRAGWPVVLAGAEIVWIPGVRRSDAATERSGRPVLSCYCELDDWYGPRR